ncbi:arylesterase [Phyllobacterium phragmitis]|uniref:Arylesterase n=1 Tax=Phyllobacterium phragmitis TaxID=2670329 RepID=A0A2S9INY7_9HYPH|nr:SGNH/GDSL hydrolase family protein [Phyllobacterium phragmitis]PRD42225.1 arylesterase [Phyllobacterium phragmitis]
MKTVLCYGDSLTWGYDATGPGRHALEDRWPSVLQEALGNQVNVIAEGLNGRTTAFNDYAAAEDRNGARVLPTILGTHAPLDLVIIMLGTNDMKPFISGSALGAKQGMRRLVDIVRRHPYFGEAEAPDVLIVAPPHIGETANPDFAALLTGGVAESRKLAILYADMADETSCGFFDAARVARTTPIDGIHMDADHTKALGRALAPVVRVMLGL